MAGKIIDVSEAIDAAKVSSLTLRVVIVSALIIFIDGLDTTNIGYVAPAMIQAWHISEPSVFGPVFGASALGIFFGAPLLGYIGDRFGRKKAIFLSCLIFAVFTWAAVLTSSVRELIIVRILCGVGIGGVMPNLIALVAEFAPKRLRATFVVVMFSGIGLGAGMPGPIAAWLIPLYGWQVIFTIGGIMGILAAFGCLVGLPESIKYSVLRAHKADVLRVLRAIRPDLSVESDSTFTLRDEKQYPGFSPKYLFRDGYAPITVCLWILFAMNLMGYFFLFSWTPTLLASANIPLKQAVLFTSMMQVGGLIGGWVVGYLIDKFGYRPAAALCILAIPVVAMIGYVGVNSASLLLVVLFLTGFSVLGFNYGTNGLSGIVYPTAFRSIGSGWCFAVGRVGSVSGPIIGGVLIGMHLSVEQLYLFAAVPYLICAPVALILARLYHRRFHAPRLDLAPSGTSEIAP
jgi:AAHS family 4-hydroxybenzoate transporter-like MFS transporter